VNPKHYLLISGIGLMLAGLLVVLGLAAWWLWSGYWVGLSLVDAIGFMSPSIAASAIDVLSDSDILYFVFVDAPLYGLLLVVGAVLLAGEQVLRVVEKP
jgi:hypothetical protein